MKTWNMEQGAVDYAMQQSRASGLLPNQRMTRSKMRAIRKIILFN
jgi:hypothetical protein